MLRVAMLSKWHVHAEGYAEYMKNQSEVEVAAVWDEDARRGADWARELGADFEPCLDTLLARKDIDAVVCCTPTNLHPSVMIRAAKAGKHIFTEKVAALTVKDCLALREAVRENHVVFTISFPQRTEAKFLYAKKLVDDGTLGDVTMLRVRNGHNGATAGWLPNYWYDPETTGGGAMMDLGAHPMYLARWLMGEPESVNSMFASYTYRQVEDSAVCSIRFKNHAIGVVESTLASFCSPYIMEIYGTKGTYYVTDDGARLAVDGTDGLQPAEIPEECAALPSPLRQFVDSCVQGKPVLFGIDDALGLTELMDAAYRSGREQRTVRIDELYE